MSFKEYLLKAPYRNIVPPILFLVVALVFGAEWQVLATILVVWFGITYLFYRFEGNKE